MLGFRGTTAGSRAFLEGINHLCRHLANCQLSPAKRAILLSASSPAGQRLPRRVTHLTTYPCLASGTSCSRERLTLSDPQSITVKHGYLI